MQSAIDEQALRMSLPRMSSPSATVPRLDAHLPPSQDGSSFAIFRANSAAFCDIGLRDGATAADFWFKTTLYQMPRAMLFRASAAGHTTRRGAEHIAQGDAQVTIHMQVEGRSVTTCPARTIDIGPGDIVIYDGAQASEARNDAYAMMALMVPRDRVPPAFLTPAAHGTVVLASSGAGRLLGRTLEALFETAEALTLAEAETAVDAMIAIVEAALDVQVARDPAWSETDRLKDKALAYIDQAIGDAALDPVRIAAQLGLSRSRLYRLFEPDGGVRAVILRQRLDRCAMAFLADAEAAISLAQLARQHGFNSEAQLSRAFRSRFGLTPRAFQDMVSRQDHAGLITQAQRAGFATLQAWLDHVAADPAGSSQPPRPPR